MRLAAALTVSIVTGLSAYGAGASPYDAESSPQGHVPTLVRELYRSPEAAGAAASADREFVDGMRRHHQGAVTMARSYLGEPGPPHPVMRKLAHAIIANQEFEIALLDDVGRKAEVPPRRIGMGLVSRQVGWDGLEHTAAFIKSPPPGVLDFWSDRTPTGEKEVRFAKAMIVHHRAAIAMADAYDGNPMADNRILKALNRDIRIDQAYEIAVMERLIARYPGNAAAVESGKIEGMPHHAGAAAPTATDW